MLHPPAVASVPETKTMKTQGSSSRGTFMSLFISEDFAEAGHKFVS